MKHANVEDVYPLSPLQEGLLFHALLDPHSPAYLDQWVVRLRGSLNADAFEAAWRHVCDRHAVLRTAFAWKSGGRPLQFVARRVTPAFSRHDWRSRVDGRERALDAFLDADRRVPFDVGTPPLCRFALIRLADDEWGFVWSRHHLLLDGWSVSLVLGDALDAYLALDAGREPPFRGAAPYRRFIEWLQQQDIGAAQRFWTETLGRVTAGTMIAAARTASPTAPAPIEIRDTIPAAEAASLTAFARSHGLTLNTLLQGAWALMLAQLTGESDVVFGATVAGRPAALPDAESMVGLFINTLPVVAGVRGSAPAVSWLQDVQRRQLEAREHDYASLVQIHGWSGVPRHQPLIAALFVFENYPAARALERPIPGLEVLDTRAIERTHYPLTLIVSPGDSIGLTWVADTAHLSDAELRRWMMAFRTLVRQLPADPARPLASISCQTAEQRDLVVRQWNDTALPLPDCTLHELVGQQAAATPDAVAVISRGAQVTYAELLARAARIRWRLQALGIGAEVPVAVCASRSPDLIAALLAVLAAGGAYLPLDPEYPAERLAFMLDDSAARIVIVDQEHASMPAFARTIRLVLDAASSRTDATDATIRCDAIDEGLGDAAGGGMPGHVAADNLAYLIYTSGSTGTPKGTAITHRSAVALVGWARTVFTREEVARVLASTSVCFDLSVFEIFVTLAMGGAVVLAENALELPRIAAEVDVTLVNTVPSAIAELVRQGPLPASVRTIALAGEPLTAALADRLHREPGVYRVLDLYGPSEATTYSTWIERAPGGPEAIGRPIANTELYIVDADFESAPIGAVGEIILGGAGLARGYLGRPDLTAERFVPDAFSGRAGARLYRTGDLGRFRPDGTVELLGRADHQVKIRGFRIELGEIRARLVEHPAIQDVAVITRTTDGAPAIAAYVVLREPQTVTAIALREYLASRIPAYMIPGAFCLVDALPRTPNGKLDRQRLPDPDPAGSTRASVVPRSLDEELLAVVWQDALERDDIGLDDNFFELGGHSLIATRIVSRIRNIFGIECPLRLIFDHPTIASLGAAVRGARLPTDGGGDAIEPGSSDDAPLSFAQQRLWFLHQLDPTDTSYHIPIVLEMRGALDVGAFEAAWHSVVGRHHVLTSVVETIDGQPRMRWQPEGTCTLIRHDLRRLAAGEREAAAARVVDEQIHAPFSLDRGPLVRAALVAVEPDRHIFASTMHHIASDEWSLTVLFRELTRVYASLVAGRAPDVTPPAVQYADFARWQRARDRAPAVERQRVYWRGQLAGLTPLQLPTDHPRASALTTRGRTLVEGLPAELAAAVRRFARREGVTLYMLLLAAFQALLARYCGQNDVAVGTPIAGRTRREIEPLVGCFVNTLVMRARLQPSSTFRQLVQRTREAVLTAHENQEVPFEDLVDELQPDRDLTTHPLVQATFAVERPLALETAPSGLQIAPLPADTATAKFDLSLVISDRGPDLAAGLQFRTDLFDQSTMGRLLTHFRALLAAALAEPDVEIAALPVASDRDRRAITVEWNRTAVAFPVVDNVVAWLDDEASRASGRIAVVDGATSLTFGELQARAHRLARYLVARGVGPHSTVAVCLERSAELVVSLLGVLEAGAAYVPIDPAYPADRVRFMLEDCAAELVITSSATAAVASPTNSVVIDREAAAIARESGTALPLAIGPDALAYILYTSGSTGRPKGVAIPHGALVNHMRWLLAAYAFTQDDVVLQKTPFSFDASVWEFYAPLLCGGRLVVAEPEGHRDPAYLARAICEHGVTILQVVPSMLALLVDEPAFADCRTLRVVFSGGEPLTAPLRDRFFSRCAARLVNLYGPTEVTIDSVAHECDRQSAEGGAGGVPIGRPVANTQAYVLDARLQPSMIGAVGELYLGGAGLARGYWRRPELTAAVFMPNPFSAALGTRLYRSGDLARYRADGTIEYVGRTDDQIKLHGFRIELGEIEAVLASHPEVVRAVAAIQRGETADRLVAYVVPAAAAQLTVDRLRAWTAKRFPLHQVPAAFAIVARLPLLPSGKIDRQALPPVVMATACPAEPALNATEATLAAIWRDLLDGVEIGRTDNFFALGGDSILAIQVVSRARTAGLYFTPRMLFQHPTIAELAAESAAMPPGEAGKREAVAMATGHREASLTPAQQWFFDLALADPHHFNQATLVTAPPDFDPDAAAGALAALGEHHASLRTRFDRQPDGTIAPRVDDHAGIPLRTIDWRDADPRVLTSELEREHRSLDIERGPLLRLAWFNAGSGTPGRLAIVAHHLIIDAMSWRVLLDDLEALYADPLRALPPADASPADWASAAGAALSDRAWTDTAEWWSRGPREPLAVPRDFTSGANLVATEEVIAAALDRGDTAELTAAVTSAYNLRVDEIVIAAFARAVSSWTGARELWLDLEGHGREELTGMPVVARTIGWFTSLYPARLWGPAADTPAAWLIDTKEQLRAIPHRGAGFGLLRFLGPDASLRQRLGTLPPREIAINYLGRFGGDSAGSRFRPAAERTGTPRSPRGRRPYLIELNASVRDHRLDLRLAYSSAVHRRSTIDSLAAVTVDTLRSFVHHVRSAGAPGFTASDFTEAGLNQDELNRLLARLAGG